MSPTQPDWGTSSTYEPSIHCPSKKPSDDSILSQHGGGCIRSSKIGNCVRTVKPPEGGQSNVKKRASSGHRYPFAEEPVLDVKVIASAKSVTGAPSDENTWNSERSRQNGGPSSSGSPHATPPRASRRSQRHRQVIVVGGSLPVKRLLAFARKSPCSARYFTGTPRQSVRTSSTGSDRAGLPLAARVAQVSKGTLDRGRNRSSALRDRGS